MSKKVTPKKTRSRKPAPAKVEEPKKETLNFIDAIAQVKSAAIKERQYVLAALLRELEKSHASATTDDRTWVVDTISRFLKNSFSDAWEQYTKKYYNVSEENKTAYETFKVKYYMSGLDWDLLTEKERESIERLPTQEETNAKIEAANKAAKREEFAKLFALGLLQSGHFITEETTFLNKVRRFFGFHYHKVVSCKQLDVADSAVRHADALIERLKKEY